MRRCQSFSSTVCSGRRSPRPALFTSTWSPPSRSAISANAARDLIAVAHVERVRVTLDLGRDGSGRVRIAVDDRDDRALVREHRPRSPVRSRSRHP